MHESSVTKAIYETVIKSAEANHAEKVIGVKLEISSLSDMEPEWLQKLFDFLQKEQLLKEQN